MSLFVRYIPAALGGSGGGGVTTVGTIDTQTPSSNGAVIVGSTLYMQSASGTVPGLVNNAAQTLSGAKTFSTAPILSSLTASLPLQLDSSKNIVSAAIDLSTAQATGTLAAGRFPALTGDITTTAGSLATTLATTIAGAHTFSGAITLSAAAVALAVTNNVTIGGTLAVTSTISASNFSGTSSGTNTGDITLAAVGSTPSANGASLSGQVLTLQVADSTHPGLLSITTQTFAGAKTFSSKPTISTLTTLQAVFTDASSGLVSNGITGSGSVVMSTSATLVTPTLGGAVGTSLALSTSVGAAQISIGSGLSTSAKLSIAGADTAMTTASARGINVAYTSNSNNTANVIGVIVGLTTAASTTVTHSTCFEADGVTVGASGTVTTAIDYFTAGASAHHGTNNAAFADNQAFTGNWFINQSGTDASKIGGATTLTNLAGTGSRAVLSDANGLLSAPVSDSRLKLNVIPLTHNIDPIASVKALSGVFFHWDLNNPRVKNHGSQQEIGLIAQDVEKVIPQAVREDKDGWKSLDYSHLVPLLIEAVKAQQKQIDELKNALRK